MNSNNYTSLDMSRRLVEAGIKVETECLWVGLKAFNKVKYKIITLNAYERESYLFDQHAVIPAPSMSELWAELPEECLRNATDFPAYKTITHNCVGYSTGTGDGGFMLHYEGNICDALAQLLIFVKGRK